MYIQFYKTTNEGEQQKAGQARMRNGRVFFRGVPELIRNELMIYGILYNGEIVFPEEGERFLNLLPFKYSGSRFRAGQKDE